MTKEKEGGHGLGYWVFIVVMAIIAALWRQGFFDGSMQAKMKAREICKGVPKFHRDFCIDCVMTGRNFYYDPWNSSETKCSD